MNKPTVTIRTNINNETDHILKTSDGRSFELTLLERMMLASGFTTVEALNDNILQEDVK